MLPDWKGRSKTSFINNMIIYVEKSYTSYKNILEIIREFNKVAGYKVTIQESIVFYTL